MDGWITVGAKLDSKQLEKDLKTAKSKLNQYDKEAQKLAEQKAKIDVDLTAYEKEKAKIQEMTDLELERAETEQHLDWILDAEKKSIEELNQKYEKTLTKNTEITKKIEENTYQQGLLNNEISEMNQKLNLAKGFESAKKNIDEISSKMDNIIHKAIKWGLAIFSIRSIYNFIKQSASTVSQYNDKVNANIEYIRYALANSLYPVIVKIINAAAKLLTYINYIAKRWFGKELFASAREFEKAQKASAGTAKNVKEIKKQLAGFDEMTVLSDTRSGLGLLGNQDILAPSIDLSNWDNVKIPEWVERIADNKDKILDFLKKVALFFATVKIGGFLTNLLKMVSPMAAIAGSAGKASNAFGIMKGLKLVAMFAGIVTALQGIIKTIPSVIDFMKNPSWSTFRDVLSGISRAAEGVGLFLVGLGKTKLGVITLVSGIIMDIASALDRMSDETERAKKKHEELQDALDNYQTVNDEYIQAVDDATEAEGRLREAENKHKIDGKKLYETVESGKLDYIDLNSAQREVYKKYKDYTEKAQKLEEMERKRAQAIQNVTEKTYADRIEQIKSKDEAVKLKDEIIKAWQEGKLTTKQTGEYMDSIANKIDTKYKDVFVKNLPKEIKDAMNYGKYSSTVSNFGNKFTRALDFLGVLNKTYSFKLTIASAAKKAMSNVENWIKKLKNSNFSIEVGYGGGGGGGRGFATGGMVVKCARGSIISQPGRGVPITQAVGGERGREGIVPLTDAQVMEQLGQTIGKYINISLTNVTKLDNRIIAREQKNINNQNDFAFNR